MAWLVGWLHRHGHRPDDAPTSDAVRDDIDRRQAAVAVRLRALQAQADAHRRPPRREGPRD